MMHAPPKTHLGIITRVSTLLWDDYAIEISPWRVWEALLGDAGFDPIVAQQMAESISASRVSLERFAHSLRSSTRVVYYQDHRMALALAMLAAIVTWFIRQGS